MTKANNWRPRASRRPTRLVWWLAMLVAGLVHSACQASPSAPQTRHDAAVVQAEGRSGRAIENAAVARGYDLGRDERRGGHTLARHVGRSDAELRERLQRERQISAASTYPDRATAERVVAVALEQDRARVDRWLAREGPRPNLALNYQVSDDESIGRMLTRRGRQTVACSAALVVLRWDGDHGFFVLTSYPELRR
ncbi:MAG: RNase A-like domain-containing protein [Vicinamibacterales bacterium]